MTDWVETYFPQEPVRKPASGTLRLFLPASVFALVIAGSLFVSLSGAPHSQMAFGGAALPGVNFARALDFSSIEPASGIGDPDKMGHEKAAGAAVTATPAAAPDFIPPAANTAVVQNGEHQVQAVLVAKNIAVISSTLDGRILKMPFQNGDTFNKGDLLVEYDCGGDVARLREVEARHRLSQSQLQAYKQLQDMQVASKIELVQAEENNAQAVAQIEQINNRLSYCKIRAPFAGRVVNKTASNHEFVQTGRVLMELASKEPLQAEFLIPSIWLRWLNVGTPLQIYVAESDKYYNARISRIHGEVDPVSQSVQVDAELESYSEVLLPGMSGKATFAPETVYKKPGFGFMGLVLPDEQNSGQGGDNNGTDGTKENNGGSDQKAP